MATHLRGLLTNKLYADGKGVTYAYTSALKLETRDWSRGDTSDPAARQSFAYAFDNIGNRISTTNAGNGASYTANNLNQYSQRTVPDEVSVIGSSHTNANVTVNEAGVERQNGYFYRVITVTNASGAVYQDTIVVGVRKNAGTGNVDVVTVETGNMFVPQTPESFVYDAGGNLLSDGRWTNAWNGENRLVSMETLDSVTKQWRAQDQT